jgi:acyl dehydratase
VRFEEFIVGQTFVSDARLVSREEIVEFARRYDNQPLHVDPVAAKDGLFGDVIGSGYMGLAIAWQLWLSTGAQGSDGRAGVALENAKWLRPMLPGAVVRAEIRVADRWLTSKGHGMIRLAFRLHEDGGSDLLTFETVGIMARADTPVAEDLAPGS